jgi:Ser/Thr protein kinase RdoA (MazF antagonist)
VRPAVTAPAAAGSRLPWDRVPAPVRAAVERALGSAVVAARDCPGGFSPGSAARLRLADGRRVFAKAVGREPNPVTPQLHRREAAATAALPPGAPAPRLLHEIDDGDWVVLVLTDVAGSLPRLPWDVGELTRVLVALTALHEVLSPCPWASAPPVAQSLAEDFGGWRRIAAQAPPTLDRWSATHLDRLVALEVDWADAAAGDTLVHADVRADNILLAAEGVVFVDWPHACRAASWVDVVAFAPSVTMQGGPRPEWMLARHPGAAGADPAAVTAVVAAFAGYLTERSLVPAPPGLPTIRAFQAAQAEVVRAWLSRRTGLRMAQ